jgi:hypothetical protein
MLYVLILDLNISQLLSNEIYISAKMDTTDHQVLKIQIGRTNWTHVPILMHRGVMRMI